MYRVGCIISNMSSRQRASQIQRWSFPQNTPRDEPHVTAVAAIPSQLTLS